MIKNQAAHPLFKGDEDINKTEEIGSSDETIESTDVVDNKNQGTKKVSTRKKSIPILDQEERREKSGDEVKSNLFLHYSSRRSMLFHKIQCCTVTNRFGQCTFVLQLENLEHFGVCPLKPDVHDYLIAIHISTVQCTDQTFFCTVLSHTCLLYTSDAADE